MSEANVEIVRALCAAWNRGDLDAAVKPFADDIEWDVSRDVWGDVVGGGHYRGIEGIGLWLRDLREAWETMDLHYEDELIDAGDEVVTLLVARGRGRHSGIEVEHHPAGVATLHDGKIVRMVWFPTREAALESVGPPRGGSSA